MNVHNAWYIIRDCAFPFLELESSEMCIPKLGHRFQFPNLIWQGRHRWEHQHIVLVDIFIMELFDSDSLKIIVGPKRVSARSPPNTGYLRPTTRLDAGKRREDDAIWNFCSIWKERGNVVLDLGIVRNISYNEWGDQLTLSESESEGSVWRNEGTDVMQVFL